MENMKLYSKYFFIVLIVSALNALIAVSELSDGWKMVSIYAAVCVGAYVILCIGRDEQCDGEWEDE